MKTRAYVVSNPMRVLCERMADLYGNPSPSHAAACVAADAADRPIFWTTTGWDEMTIQHVAWLATAGGELRIALDRFSTDMDPPRREILDALVPLNHKAILQLRMAYATVGLYPTIPSLHARTEKRA
jgi:hypothetical protein